MNRILWLAAAAAMAAPAQQTSAITREGSYWTDTVSGSVPAQESLRISTTGGVSVQGGAGGAVTYTVKRRTKVRNEASARALFQQISVKTSSRGGWTVVEVMVPDSHRAWAELRLQVPRRLRETTVASHAGSIQAVDLDGSLRADTGGGSVDVDRVQGAVAVRTGGGAVKIGKVGGKLDCYSSGGSIVAESIGGEAGLNTGGGEIVVREAKSPITAKTLGGNIRIERAAGTVRVAAGAGLIDILQAGGPVVAETGAGSIKIRSANGVNCQSGAGTIHLQAVSGGLQAMTKAGSILADLGAARGFQDSTLSTSMGDITVLIPSKFPVTVEAMNSTPGGHRIVSDFSEIHPRLEQGNSRSAARGSINGGGPTLRLAASGGTIYLRRQQ